MRNIRVAISDNALHPALEPRRHREVINIAVVALEIIGAASFHERRILGFFVERREDRFPAGDRSPGAVYNLGTTLGAALGYMLIAQLIPSGPVTLPLLGTVAPWQSAAWCYAPCRPG